MSDQPFKSAGLWPSESAGSWFSDQEPVKSRISAEALEVVSELGALKVAIEPK